nr:MAG TPA: hypothetical protein [Caudoviricetes sp.]DAK19297.1 MAG TPA: hypothetical protein [Caudoviricetes sp.]
MIYKDIAEANIRITFLEFVLSEKEKVLNELLSIYNLDELDLTKARIRNDEINKLVGNTSPTS